jgi:hypothetical protein
MSGRLAPPNDLLDLILPLMCKRNLFFFSYHKTTPNFPLQTRSACHVSASQLHSTNSLNQFLGHHDPIPLVCYNYKITPHNMKRDNVASECSSTHVMASSPSLFSSLAFLNFTFLILIINGSNLSWDR